MLDIKDIYENRNKLRELYDHDTKYGDLVGALLGIREKNKCVEAMDIRIQGEYKIAIDLAENTEYKEASKIGSQVLNCLESYIEDNYDKIGVSKQFFEYSKKVPSTICDLVLVGNSLQIML